MVPKISNILLYIQSAFSIELNIIFRMKILYFCCLLLSIQAQISSGNFFRNLPNLNKVNELAQKADDSVNFLITFLNINFNCPSNTPYYQTQKAFGLPSIDIQTYNPIPNGYFSMQMIPYMQKFTLYNQLRNIISILNKLKESFVNNAVIGNGNIISGSNNIVIGNQNRAQGNSNWILASNYNSKDVQDGVLVLTSNYMVQLAQFQQVAVNPSVAIKCVNGQQTAQLISTFWNNARGRVDVKG